MGADADVLDELLKLLGKAESIKATQYSHSARHPDDDDDALTRCFT